MVYLRGGFRNHICSWTAREHSQQYSLSLNCANHKINGSTSKWILKKCRFASQTFVHYMLRCVAIRYLLPATFLITVAHSIIPHHHGEYSCNESESHCISCCETQDDAGHPQHCQFKTEVFTDRHHVPAIFVYAIVLANIEIPDISEQNIQVQPQPFRAKPLDGICRSASLRAPPIFS